MASSDELLGQAGVGRGQLAARLMRELKPGRLNVFTLHGEVEGRILLDEFRGFLRLALAEGVVFERLIDSARRISRQAVPRDRVVWGEVPGRAYEVAWQQSALEHAV